MIETHIDGATPEPEYACKFVAHISHRTLMGRWDARTLLYNIKEQRRTSTEIQTEGASQSNECGVAPPHDALTGVGLPAADKNNKKRYFSLLNNSSLRLYEVLHHAGLH